MGINQELRADLVLPESASSLDTRPVTGVQTVMVADEDASERSPFLGASQHQAAQAIRRALAERHVFVALTGAPGLGKTTLLTAALVAPPGRQLRTIRVVDPDWITAELARQIEQVAFEPAERTGHGELQPVIVVDDAHTSSPELLRCLTRIAVKGWSDPRSPQVILAGRPELWDKLAPTEFEPLVERITFRPVLEPLSDEDARGVIERALEQPRRISGQKLTGDAAQEVLRFARGMPGRIDMVVSSALTLRDVETQLPVSADMVRSAAAALDGKPGLQGRETFVGGRVLAFALLTAALVTAGLVLNAQGWPPGRVLSAALSPVRRAEPARTPSGDAAPVIAETLPQPSTARPDADAQGSASARPMPPPVEPPPAGQAAAEESTTSVAAGRGPDPQDPPLTPVSPGGDEHPAAAASDTGPSSTGQLPAAETASPVAAVPPPISTASAPATPSGSPSPSPDVTARPDPRPAAPEATAPVALSPKMVALLLQRGDEVLALGDYAAARRLYERTVPAGSAVGARNVARSYDPALLGRANGAADPVAAATWYGVAASLGDAYSAARLQELRKTDAPGPNASPAPAP